MSFGYIVDGRMLTSSTLETSRLSRSRECESRVVGRLTLPISWQSVAFGSSVYDFSKIAICLSRQNNIPGLSSSYRPRRICTASSTCEFRLSGVPSAAPSLHTLRFSSRLCEEKKAHKTTAFCGFVQSTKSTPNCSGSIISSSSSNSSCASQTR